MSNNKQTAVEWLISQIEEKTKNGTFCTIDYMRKHCFKQAKEMEKEQIIDAYNEDLYGGLSGKRKFDDGEQYYNGEYNK